MFQQLLKREAVTKAKVHISRKKTHMKQKNIRRRSWNPDEKMPHFFSNDPFFDDSMTNAETPSQTSFTRLLSRTKKLPRARKTINVSSD